MPDRNDNGPQADIPQEAIDEALRSVERSIHGDEGEADPRAGGGDQGHEESERVRELQAMLEDSAARAAETKRRLDETHEARARLQADFENFKKRWAKEREDTVKYGNERLLKDLLPVLDNLERAVAASGSGTTTLSDGLRLVLKQFGDALARFGVQSFTSIGEVFDPSRHEALMQQESDSPPNTVIAELAKGFMLNDRLIRPAAVVVSKGRTAPSPNPSASPSASPSPNPLPNGPASVPSA